MFKLDAPVKSPKLITLSFPRKRKSSNYMQLWIPDQVGNDKMTEILTFYETIKLETFALKKGGKHNGFY